MKHIKNLDNSTVNKVDDSLIMLYGTSNNLSQSEINAANDEQTIDNKLKIIGGLTTSAAIASTALASSLWAIPFYGWVEEGFAIADTAADWAASGCTWALYNNIHNKVARILSYVAGAAGSGIAAVETPYDVYELITSVQRAAAVNRAKVIGSLSADAATNLAGSTAEPEVAPWIEPALDAVILTLDTLGVSLVTMTILQG